MRQAGILCNLRFIMLFICVNLPCDSWLTGNPINHLDSIHKQRWHGASYGGRSAVVNALTHEIEQCKTRQQQDALDFEEFVLNDTSGEPIEGFSIWRVWKCTCKGDRPIYKAKPEQLRCGCSKNHVFAQSYSRNPDSKLQNFIREVRVWVSCATLLHA